MPPTANVLQVRPTFHPFQKQSAAHKSEETADLVVVFSSAEVSAARGGQGLSEGSAARSLFRAPWQNVQQRKIKSKGADDADVDGRTCR